MEAMQTPLIWGGMYRICALIETSSQRRDSPLLFEYWVTLSTFVAFVLSCSAQETAAHAAMF